ncbi:MAG: hypothetical protein HY207_01075 [Nitrospirae bacterium]|nr:hypothetical protein [Nitrospirota bacterium]
MRAAIRELGSAPGRAVFAKRCGVTAVQVKRFWPNHSKLVAAAGSSPNAPSAQMEEDELFREYAKVCRHYGHIPSQAELRIATREIGTRTHRVQNRFGGLAPFNNRFKEWLSSAPQEFVDILTFPGWGRVPFGKGGRALEAASPIATARHPFLPVGLLALLELASNRLPQGFDTDLPPSLLFERKCADAFRALGFQVRNLGQGKGRAADCLALARPDRFAVIIDAKARTEGFALGTEDRKFIEYAKLHSDGLRGEGVERVYLCIVSSAFREKDVDVLRRALTGSGLHGWSLWPADVLMTTVEKSISERSDFRLSDLEQRFALNAVAT